MNYSTADRWRVCDASNNVKSALANAGAVHITALLDAAQVLNVREWLRALERRGHAIAASYEPEFEQDGGEPGDVLRKARRLYWNDPEFWGRFLVESGMRDWACRLVEQPALIFHATFLKPAGVGSAVGFHQDQALWPRLLPGAVTIWVALDAANEKNGCLLGVRGSHTHGLLPHVETPAHPWHATVPISTLNLPAPEPVLMNPGDAIAWHRYFLHGSDENRSNSARRGMVMVFAPRHRLGCYAQDVHLI